MGGKSKNTIELNGRRYDAFTGNLIDNFTRVGTGAKKGASNLASAVPKVTEATSKTAHDIKRRVNHKPAHHPEKSKTLMRTTVQNPEKSKIKLSKAQIAKSDSLIASTAELLDTRASRKALANARRKALSEQIAQSPKVRKFTDTVVSYAGPKAANIGISLPGQPVNAAPKAVGVEHDSKAHLQEMLAAGLAKAKSHEQPAPKTKRHKRRARFITWSVVLAVLIAGGALVYAFRADLELQMAAMRSGVHAELPGYIPTGYSFKGSIHYSSGTVTVNYKNGPANLTIDEKNSTWDSPTLRDSIVDPTGTNYESYQSKGRTIYLYGPGKASWVNDGIWYLVSSSPQISDVQLEKIANSM